MSDPTLNQDEIDALLAGVPDPTEGPMESGGGGSKEPSLSMDDLAGLDDMGGGSQPAPAASDSYDLGGDDFAAMMDEAPAPQPAARAAAPAAKAAAVEVAGDYPSKNIEVLLDIPLQVVVELGHTEMPIQKILELGPGSVVELNRLAGEPINILVNGKLVARGEVVVVDENFGVKITHIISPMERLSQLN
ncbi:MAG: flagellar motor switch protein FliN [bacterium]